MSKLVFLVLAVLLCMPSCKCASVQDRHSEPPAALIVPKAPEPSALPELERKLSEATERGDNVARLALTKDIISEKLRIVEAEKTRLKTLLSTTETALRDARLDASAAKLWVFVGIMGVACLGLVALAIFVPSVSKFAVRGAVACGATAALAAFVTWLLPWLLLVGALVLAVVLIGAVVYWRLDAKSRDQVVRAVEELKPHVPSYKAVFREHIDTDADAVLDATRKRLGLSPSKQGG